MNCADKVDFGMTDEEKKLALEYDEMTNQIKDLTKKLKKLRMRLKSTRVKLNEELNIEQDIIETEKYIKHRIFARNKINDKLYKKEVI